MLTGTSSIFYLSCHFNSYPCFVQSSTVTAPPHKSTVILFFKSITKLRSKLEASPSIIRTPLPHSWVVKRAQNRKTLMKEPYSWLNEDSFHFQTPPSVSLPAPEFGINKKKLQLPGAPQPPTLLLHHLHLLIIHHHFHTWAEAENRRHSKRLKQIERTALGKHLFKSTPLPLNTAAFLPTRHCTPLPEPTALAPINISKACHTKPCECIH